jgi:O-antigen/teichoic acid export membrane protein
VILQSPVWVFYRRMRFVRQRLLQAADPLVGFIVAVSLAVAGAGYWSLVFGTLAGAWAAAIVALRFSPYPLRFRYDRGTLRSYVSFSWPLFVASGAGMVIAQGSVLVGQQALGLAGAGAIGLAATITQFGDRVDQVVTGTLYPAICAVRERTDLLFESFAKSNRLALTCAFPFGVAVALFARDLVHFGIGDRWRPALVLLEVFGLLAAFNQIGFNWDAYFRARGDTRPIAVTAVVTMIAFLAAAIPGLILFGLDGFAAGVGVMTLVNLCCRSYYLRRLFTGFRIVRHGLRAVAPTALATLVILGLRALESGTRPAGLAVAELALYLGLIAAITFALERPLLREVAGYLRSRGRVTAPAA